MEQIQHTRNSFLFLWPVFNMSRVKSGHLAIGSVWSVCGRGTPPPPPCIRSLAKAGLKRQCDHFHPQDMRRIKLFRIERPRLCVCVYIYIYIFPVVSANRVAVCPAVSHSLLCMLPVCLSESYTVPGFTALQYLPQKVPSAGAHIHFT
jgi:hypothetical protein